MGKGGHWIECVKSQVGKKERAARANWVATGNASIGSKPNVVCMSIASILHSFAVDSFQLDVAIVKISLTNNISIQRLATMALNEQARES
jgi:hypothetical protein